MSKEVFLHNLEVAKKKIGGVLALSKFIGCKNATISNWRLKPPINNHSVYVATLALYLEVSYEDLFNTKLPMPACYDRENFLNNLNVAITMIGGFRKRLARLLGCSNNLVFLWQGGEGVPKSKTVFTEKLANYLDISIDELFLSKLPIPETDVFKHNLDVAIAKAGSQTNLAKILKCSPVTVFKVKHREGILAKPNFIEALIAFLGVTKKELFYVKLPLIKKIRNEYEDQEVLLHNLEIAKNRAGGTDSSLIRILGCSTGLLTNWRNISVPKNKTEFTERLANYLGVDHNALFTQKLSE